MNFERQIKENLEKITDPVTLKVFVDPVMLIGCRHTFSRSVITDLLNSSSHPCCPVCRINFEKYDIVTNYTLRNLIPSILQLMKLLESDAQNESNSASMIYPENIGIKIIQHKSNTMISVVPDNQNYRIPVILILCIDISASMNTQINRWNKNGEEINDGLTRFDIVKHSARALINGLDDDCHVGIVTFSEVAYLNQTPIQLTSNGRLVIEKIISDLDTMTTTNLWGGIEQSLEALRTFQSNISNRSICLLTDGVPTEEYQPTLGYTRALDRYIDRHPDFKFSMHTIGFGYELNSYLLDKIAKKLNGSFCFVPDGSMVGTIFAHIGANLSVNIGSNAILKLGFESVKNAKKCLNVLPGSIEDAYDITYDFSIDSSNIMIKLGPINLGQARSICIPTSANLEYVCLTYNHHQQGEIKTILVEDVKSVKKIVTDEFSSDASEVLSQYVRQIAISVTNSSINYAECIQHDKAIEILSTGIEKILIEIGFTNDPLSLEILKDVQGQITQALSNSEHYNKWGKHYLLSLLRAYSLHQCNNFKDPGIQMFGGDMFKSVRDIIDDKFNTMSPPILHKKYENIELPIVMSTYNSSRAPCFHGDGLVAMKDNTFKKVSQINPGDKVKGSKIFGDDEKRGYVVKYVIISACKNNVQSFVNYEGLYITPTHPIVIHNPNTHLGYEFCRPIDIVKFEESKKCDNVYNFVLESGHVININNVECVTLGHGFTGNEHIEHPFYGTNLIVDQLKEIIGLDRGKLFITAYDVFLRDQSTSWVVGFDPKKTKIRK